MKYFFVFLICALLVGCGDPDNAISETPVKTVVFPVYTSSH